MRHICAILSTPSRLRKALKTKTSYPLADHSTVSRISCPLGGEGSAFLSFFAGGHYWPYTEVCKFVISYISTRIACYNGLIVQAAINNLLPLFYVIIQRDFNVSVEKLGMLTAVNFVTQLLVDLFAAAFVDRLGWRRSICLSHILAVAGFAALSFLPGMIDPYMAVVISVIVYASGSAIIEVMVSPIVEALPSTDKGGQMALLHSFYCWGQLAVVLLSTVALAVFGEWLWKYLPLFWAIVPIVNFFLFLKTPLVIPDHVQEKKRLGSELRALFTNPMFLLMMLMMLCAGACELAMAQWASYFAEAALGTSKLLGDLLGPCMFALFMGAGRLTYSLAQRKPSPPQIVAMCAGLCIVCYAVAGLSGNAYVSLAACALTGLSVSLMWPCTFSYAASCLPVGGTAMFALLATCGDIGCALGPAVMGYIADLSSFRTALTSMTVFPMLLLAASVFVQTKRLRRN